MAFNYSKLKYHNHHRNSHKFYVTRRPLLDFGTSLAIFALIFTGGCQLSTAHFYGKFRENPSSSLAKYPVSGSSSSLDRGYFDAEIDGKESCNRKCMSSKQCCDGYSCAKSMRNAFAHNNGFCVVNPGDKENMPCAADSECFPYECKKLKAIYPALGFCQKPDNSLFVSENAINPYNGIGIEKKHFNDDCTQSSDCDESKGLCCSRVRYHRQQSSLKCWYREQTNEKVNCIDKAPLSPTDDGESSSEAVVENAILQHELGDQDSNDDTGDAPISNHIGVGYHSHRKHGGGGMSRFFPKNFKPYFK